MPDWNLLVEKYYENNRPDKWGRSAIDKIILEMLDEEEEEIFEEMDFLRIKRMSRNVDVENPPIMVGMMMNGKDTSIELDTGAVVTVMSDDEYSKFKSDDLPLKKSNLALKTYTGEIVRPRGIGSVDVDYEGQKCRLPVTVVDGD